MFTDPKNEAIINRIHGKSVEDYERIMIKAMMEAFRVLRSNHWMVLVFMNSSEKVWRAIRTAVGKAGFLIERTSVFDKQHGTFKQFVSDNTAGSDLMLHCRKPDHGTFRTAAQIGGEADVERFLAERSGRMPITPFIHVERRNEIDYRALYSQYVASAFKKDLEVVSFPEFRQRLAVMLD